MGVKRGNYRDFGRAIPVEIAESVFRAQRFPVANLFVQI